MNFLNKITNFLFPKKEPIKFSLTDKEAGDLVLNLLTNCKVEYITGYLLGYYLSGSNKNEIEQKIKTLREAIVKFQERENSLMEDNGN